MKKTLFIVALAAMTACAGNTQQSTDKDKGLEAATEFYEQINEEVEAEKANDAEAKEAAQEPKGEVKEILPPATLPERPSRPVFVDFNATWCGPCRAFGPVFEAAAAKYGDRADFLSVDVDKNPDLARKYQVQSIPMILCITPNGEVTRSVGAMDARQFGEYVEFHFE